MSGKLQRLPRQKQTENDREEMIYSCERCTRLVGAMSVVAERCSNEIPIRQGLASGPRGPLFIKSYVIKERGLGIRKQRAFHSVQQTIHLASVSSSLSSPLPTLSAISICCAPPPTTSTV